MFVLHHGMLMCPRLCCNTNCDWSIWQWVGFCQLRSDLYIFTWPPFVWLIFIGRCINSSVFHFVLACSSLLFQVRTRKEVNNIDVTMATLRFLASTIVLWQLGVLSHYFYTHFIFLFCTCGDLSIDRLHMILIYFELVPIAVILKQANFVTWQNLDNLSCNTKYKIFSSFLGTSTESVYRLLRFLSSGLPLWLVILFGQ